MQATQRYLITGVARGVGYATAEKLIQAGHQVVGLDRDAPEVDPGLEHFHQVDLNDTKALDAVVEALGGRFDGLCNIAGLPPRDGLESVILRVNFLAVRELTRQVLPLLNPGASIVNLASRAGQAWQTNIDQVKRLSQLDLSSDVNAFIEAEGIDPTRAYNLSKEALIAWTLAQTEVMLQRGIRINSLSPGAVSTAILEDFTRAFGDKVVRNLQRAGRAGKPEEAADAVVYMLSQQSTWLKGTDLVLDGGMSAFAAVEQFGLDCMNQ